MSKSISEINEKIRQLNKRYKKSGLTDGKISQKAAMSALKGDERLKMSDEAKKEISKRMKGKVKSKSHIEKLKKKKLKYKITKEEILQAQIGTTTAKEVAYKLGIDVHTYKNIATFHKVYKKQSLSERNTIVGNKPILVFDYNTKQFIKECNSIAEACREFNVTNVNSVLKGLYKQCKGYYFEYKK